MNTKLLSPEEDVPITCIPPVFSDTLPDVSKIVHIPARLAPSALPEEIGDAKLMYEWDARFRKPKCKASEYNLLGNAFHNFIALNPQTDPEKVAVRILENWRMTDAVCPGTLVVAANRLYTWIENEYPGSKIQCEVPMTYRNKHGQLLQGFIDMLIETPNGNVIIDHKTGMPKDAIVFASSHAAQLNIYKRAVEKATGKPVLATIINMPLLEKLILLENK